MWKSPSIYWDFSFTLMIYRYRDTKGAYMPQTEAHKRATLKYETKAYDKVLVRIRKDGDLTRKDIQKSADAKGESLNQYILKAVEMRMEQDI